MVRHECFTSHWVLPLGALVCMIHEEHVASFIAPRTPANGVYSDKVRVPAGVTLSVVAY